MKIWVVNEGEPLPMLTGKGRLMRGGMFAKTFSEMGDDVTWWFSTWLHYEKRYYCTHPETIQLSKNLTLRLLHVKHAYKKNISIERILYCSTLSKKFKKAIKSEEQKPDVIYCSWPLIELSYECVKYGKENHIPVVLDIRDKWPVIFTQPFHGVIKKVVQLGVDCLYKKKSEYSFQNATEVISVVPKGLDLAYRYGRPKNDKDHAVYLAFDPTVPSEEKMKEAYEFLEGHEILRSKDQCRIVYFGSISLRLVLFEELITAAKLLPKNTCIICCGSGSDLEKLRLEAKGLDTIQFPGYLNEEQLYVLKKESMFGLLPYKNTEDFIDSLPNKFGEYLAGGLPIFTTLKGLSRQIIESANCGAFFDTPQHLIDLVITSKNDKVYPLLHKNALHVFSEQFNANDVYKKFENELKTISKFG